MLDMVNVIQVRDFAISRNENLLKRSECSEERVGSI